ncbi:MAG: glycoside hydrolase family 3 C-terminal domain-containing protein [Flavobacteriaceae bacterium]|nr:glycoside hydrolase family 3 C-terminal domain-containing protein [Flavobacteriaceae bacterium]
MTLDEKVKALSTNPSVPRLGVIGTDHVEGLHGLALGGPANWGGKDKEPVPTTTFPQAYGLGETWDTELLEKVAAVEGYETRYIFEKYKRGAMVVRAPNADLARDPRWGRTEESFGEDAFFTGKMAVAFIKGLQGNDGKYWQTASLMKHFLANSNEDGRTYTSSDFDERLWREYYALPFKMGVVEGGSRAYMAAYNKVNGIPAMVHPMLKEITEKEWGQNGIICTDGGAYKLLMSDHKYYADKYLAAAAVIKAGINQFLDEYLEGVYGALANGYLSESDLDHVLRGVYRVMIKLGQLDPDDQNPYKKIASAGTIDPWLSKEHKDIALLASQKSIVLLKNESKLLPLKKKDLKTIAVIGPNANGVFLDWYSGTPPYTVTALEGIKSKAGPDTKILYTPNNSDGLAVDYAKKADVVIVVRRESSYLRCRLGQMSETQQWQRRYGQAIDYFGGRRPIKLVYQANPKTIVCLISSFPYAINWTQENVPAIVHLTHNSQELGNALADVLFGDFNPAGRLTQTWVKSIHDLSDFLDYDISRGRTYMYSKEEPLYAFGYGLSYTSFEYANLKTNMRSLSAGDRIMVSVDVKNTGKSDGDEVVQLYIKHLDSKIQRPLKELKGFQRVFIEAGKTVTVQIPLNASDLNYWNVARQEFELEKDRIEVQIGSASNNIKQTKTLKVN